MILIQTQKTLRPLGPTAGKSCETRHYTFASRLPLAEALLHMGAARQAHALMHEAQGYAATLRFVGYQQLPEDLGDEAMAEAMLFLIEDAHRVVGTSTAPDTVEA
jgi:hypothetical protein